MRTEVVIREHTDNKVIEDCTVITGQAVIKVHCICTNKVKTGLD